MKTKYGVRRTEKGGENVANGGWSIKITEVCSTEQRMQNGGGTPQWYMMYGNECVE